MRMSRRKEYMTSQATMTLPSSCVLPRNTACMSLSVQVHTYVQNGRWVVCLGGFSRKKTSSFVTSIRTSWSRSNVSKAR